MFAGVCASFLKYKSTRKKYSQKVLDWNCPTYFFRHLQFLMNVSRLHFHIFFIF